MYRLISTTGDVVSPQARASVVPFNLIPEKLITGCVTLTYMGDDIEIDFL